jgi:hypothetical protein
MWQSARYKYWAWLIVAVFMLLVSKMSHAALTDIKFGQSQIADSQWNVSACTTTTTCQIYSKQPGTMYKIPWTSGQWSWQPGQYVQFSLTGNASYPYEGKVYNSNGTLAGTIGTGKIVNMGPDYFFFVGNDNNTGQLFSGSTGMSSTGGVSWTGTLNPTIQQADTYANASYSTVPLTAGQTATSTPNSSGGPPPPNWQVIRTNSNPVVISNIYPTSYNSPNGEGAANAFDGNPNTKYLNFDKKNAGVTVKLSQGRVVQKFTLTTANDFSGRDPTSYKLYGSNDGVNWTLIKQDSLSLSENRFWTSPEIVVNNTNPYVYYFILFPTTKSGDGCGLNCDSMQIAEVTYYYDLNDGVTSTDTGSGGTPANPGQAGSVCSDCYSSNITATQQALLDAARARRNAISLGNHIRISADGSSPNITVEQIGSYNTIQGLSGAGTYATVNGFGNTVNIKQGDTLSGKNLIEMGVQGNGNVVNISQARNTTTGAIDGSESGGHIIRLSVIGNSATYNLRQGNDGGPNSGHFLNFTINGGGGTHNVTQANNGEKLAFVSITGNFNNETIVQSGTGNHFLDLTLSGNGNSANITQTGSGSHKATINLANVGGPSAATVIQQGSTNQIYSITQQCANLSGCSVSITQGTGP